MKRVLFLLASLCFLAQMNAQFSISGRITDEKEIPLEGANIYLSPGNKGTVSNSNGDFILTGVKKGNYEIYISHIGYTSKSEQITVDKNLTLDFTIETSVIWGEEIIVRATRADNKTPTTYSTVKKEEIEKLNLGQDLPYLIGMEPSLVYSSDAGAGVGYTGLWIRGSNIQRINVTINGIPLNDPESHTVYWVDVPDFASSIQSAQIQRGVGTSTNGGGAFGATINLQTNYINPEAYGEVSNSYGSFNTLKNTIRIGTGLIKDRWTFEGRASSIISDGYIDRASSDLKSYLLQGAYLYNNTTIKAIVFGGKEKTYQAWYGVDEYTMRSDRTFNWAGAKYDESWNVTGFYDNEIDFYQQDHCQLHVSQKISSNWNFNFALHYTYGRGYYEQYYSNEYLGDYPIHLQISGNDTVEYSDLIVRRWLDNHFYGSTGAIHYNSGKLSFIFGGAWNNYAPAKHFGEIIWAEYAGSSEIRDNFYENESEKNDFNIFEKTSLRITDNLELFTDIQMRRVQHLMNGIDKGADSIDIDMAYTFINPKAGITYSIEGIGSLYASYAIANREPIRDDFLDAPEGITPEPERLHDIEIGIRKTSDNFFYSLNYYFMLYNNQLVLNGKINDVGLPVRENIGKSYRTGFELDLGRKFSDYVSIRSNVTIGKNWTDFINFEENQIITYKNVQLTYSPQLISGYMINIKPFKIFEISLTGKYVSRQYLDLTENKDKSLDPYYINNIRMALNLHPILIEEINISVQVNNLWNTKYASNGYTWDDTPYFFPQAGTNLMAGISVKF